MLETEPRLATLLAEPHHDGSEAYVLERPAETPGTAVVRLRVPHGTAVDAVALRRVKEGEARVLPAVVDAETDTDTWWRVSFDVSASATRYRWLLSGGDYGYAWLNGMGVVPYDPPDADDFVLSLDPSGPDWHLGSVVYEIYPDRFGRGGAATGDPPEWAVPREWDELPTGRGKLSSLEWFGGDLPGIEQRLDHLESLGVNVLYLTPFFPAGSTHRYDAASFDRVDPLLGGDEALASLVRAAHARGLRILGDLTTNHTGVGHEWFQAREPFYYFDDELPHGYEAWLGIASLPKLDWGSPRLREAMLAVSRRWLDAGLDGWRIDVANMTGRLSDADANADVARALRQAAGPDRVLIAEHFHDYRLDLVPGGWNGVMNYAGFLKPTWSWLRDDAAPDLERNLPLPSLDGTRIATTMRAFRAGVPWQATLNSWALLDSHDTARFRTIAGSRERQLVGIGLQMTTPGVPMVYAGDELGLEGRWGEDGRRPMPWSRPDDWDRILLDGYRDLIALRRSSPALARGGIRYAHVDADVLCYLRETEEERLLCLASRARHAPLRVPFTSLETLYGDDAEDGVLPADGPSFHVWRIL